MAANTHQVFGDVFIFSKCLFLIEYNSFFYFYDNKATDLACCWNLTRRDEHCGMNAAVCIEKMPEDRWADFSVAFHLIGRPSCWSGCLSIDL